jgi:hypothetical protein
MSRTLKIVFTSTIIIAVFAGAVVWKFSEKNGTEHRIRLESPAANEAVSSPLFIRGEARGTWYFEASFPIEIIDANGTRIGMSFAEAEEDWMTENFVPFHGTIEFSPPTTKTGTLILHKDNPSGLPEFDDELRIPIRFSSSLPAENTDTIVIKLFFNNVKKSDEEGINCSPSTYVERTIPKTEGVAKAAIEELLKGPTAEETAKGFTTNINDGVQLQSISLKDGVLRADFSPKLEYLVGGSCRVAAIRSQIEKTLLQFSTITSVIISINGRTNDILQP